ncbi:UbiA prenyltransferase family protein [Natronoarchaeum philippinense]|uniref:UbiA prenyltransferase family protein n=1 Tax=Natronoarchaeum philippinense TaxID=558529 RepID=A0A285NY49_NATPI|nr:UbiA family prenyltransferase [Natronoarchaeum philippinense]SNZ12806.1 UbiA prenyltransferase family protein [Natronoarchaeum philippinense]
MAIARHGTGPQAELAALGSQVHPVFMLPPVAASLFGAVVAGQFDPVVGSLHAVAIFAAVYTAHVKDGYVDFYGRGEDEDHPLTESGCRYALAGASVVCFACIAALGVLVGPGAALLTLPCWLIAYHHAPQLDTNPITTTTGYPAGVALSILGGYYVQTGALAVEPVAFAVVFLGLLSGVKVIDDAQDYDYDRSIRKRTVAVAVGPERAWTVAYGLMLSALALVVVLAVTGPFPLGGAVAAAAFGVVAAIARRADTEIATMLLIRGSYVFLAVLVAAVWWRPLG